MSATKLFFGFIVLATGVTIYSVHQQREREKQFMRRLVIRELKEMKELRIKQLKEKSDEH